MAMAEGRRMFVITGVTRGLGHALALAAARAGHRVAGCGRNTAALAALRARLPPPHELAQVDVADGAAVKGWADAVGVALGPPDLLIANAGLINRTAPLWGVPPAEFASVVDVNLKGVFHTCHAFLPAMIAAGRGVVVNLSSGWGRSTDAGVAPYCATKFAVEGLTRALAQDLPPGLAAVALNPGVIDTDMLRSCWAEEAGSFPGPEAWVKRALPYLLGLGPRDNGKSLTVPE